MTTLLRTVRLIGIVGALVIPAWAASSASPAPRQPASRPSGAVWLPAWDVARTAAGSAGLNDVISLGPADTWTVGTAGGSTRIERWNGRRFVVVPSPNKTGRDNILEAVDGVSPTDLWAVGHADLKDGGVGSTALIEHWDGAAWRTVSSPSVPDHLNDLTGVVAESATDAWAVGTLSDFSPGSTPILLHWDGNRWSRASNGCVAGLSRVDARSESDIWAVGGTQTCHFNGSAWVDVAAAPPTNREHTINLLDVTAVSATSVWAVGEESFSCGEGGVCYSGVIEHWNGKKWTYLTDYVPVLYGVDATGPANIYAVGSGTSIIHYDGSTWQEVPNVPDIASLNAVTVTNTDAWAVGDQPANHPRSFAERAPSPNSGAVVGDTNVSGATVSWFGKENGSVQTDQYGSYQIGGLQAGAYTFTATYAGCQPDSARVEVKAGTTIGRSFHIKC